MGVVWAMWSIFQIFGPNYIFVMGETRHFEYEEY